MFELNYLNFEIDGLYNAKTNSYKIINFYGCIIILSKICIFIHEFIHINKSIVEYNASNMFSFIKKLSL